MPCDHCGKPSPYTVLCADCEQLVCLECGRVECVCNQRKTTMSSITIHTDLPLYIAVEASGSMATLDAPILTVATVEQGLLDPEPHAGEPVRISRSRLTYTQHVLREMLREAPPELEVRVFSFGSLIQQHSDGVTPESAIAALDRLRANESETRTGALLRTVYETAERARAQVLIVTDGEGTDPAEWRDANKLASDFVIDLVDVVELEGAEFHFTPPKRPTRPSRAPEPNEEDRLMQAVMGTPHDDIETANTDPLPPAPVPTTLAELGAAATASALEVPPGEAPPKKGKKGK